MSREIKFRAWDKKYKEMINYIWIAPEYDWGVYSDNDALCERERAKEDQIEIMQYTGLKDKNGKEIYEGDIVRGIMGAGSGFQRRPGKEQIFEVWSDTLADGCHLRGIWRLSGDYRGYPTFDQVEVIGNVYENHELLK